MSQFNSLELAPNPALGIDAEPRGVSGSGIGDVAALYRELAGRLEQIVRINVHASEVVIEDACQFAWSRLLYHRARVQQETALGWLVKTAIHEAFKLSGRGRRDLSLEVAVEQGIEPAALTPGPAELLERREQMAAIGGLGERQRRLVWLRALGLSYDEMAAHERCTRRTVERELLRARRTLRAAVKPAA